MNVESRQSEARPAEHIFNGFSPVPFLSLSTELRKKISNLAAFNHTDDERHAQ